VEVRELIRDLGRGGRTIILSSHLLAETELVCDHVAVLGRGKLIVQGNIKELLHEKDSFWLGTTNDRAAAAVLAGLPAVEHVVPVLLVPEPRQHRRRDHRARDAAVTAGPGATHARLQRSALRRRRPPADGPRRAGPRRHAGPMPAARGGAAATPRARI